MGAAVGIRSHFHKARKSKITNFAQEPTLFGLPNKYILQLDIPMNDLVLVYDLNSFEYLVEDVECLIKGEYFGGEFALDGVEVAHVAVLHDEEVPVTFCVKL